MDAKEAIEEFNKYKSAGFNNYAQPSGMAVMLAFEALEKVETLEAENARLRERETPKEAISTGYWQVNIGGRLLVECPSCGGKIGYLEKFCSECGQAIKIVKE